ncbi:MAG: tetratricopeptide repeat protein, partial [Nitrospinaceae bacterium]
MKKIFKKFLFKTLVFSLPVLGICSLFSPAWGMAAEFNLPIQITTHPGEDFAGSVSPDGKFLVYVSDRSGNLDLWLKHLGAGLNPPDRRLTFHSAEDNAPAVSPDGKRIAFVSNRSDAKGDIYLLDLDKSGSAQQPPDPERLTGGDFMENGPAWSPDRKFIFFTSPHPASGKKMVFKIDLKTRERSIVIESGGLNPAPSPDGRYLAFVAGEGENGLWVFDLQSMEKVRLTSGAFIDLSPQWSRDGRRVFFTRYGDDTNFDGQVTIEDNPNIWSVGFSSGRPGISRQLTDSSSYDLLASSAGSEKLFFTSNRKNSIDVWEVPAEGIMPSASGYGMSLQTAEDLCSEGPPSYPCLLAYRNVAREFDGEKSLSRLRYRIARGYQELGNRKTARGVYSEIIRKHPDDATYKGLAELELLLLETALFENKGPSVYKKKLSEGLLALEKLTQGFRDNPRVASRGLLETGHMLLKLEDPARALSFYKKVIAAYPGQRAVSAEAAFSQSGIYKLVGNQEKLVQAFVQVVRDYYDVESWTQKAIREILSLFEKHPTLEKKVSSLQALIIRYPEPERLAASVQNRIGELYHKASENLLAKEAYRKTVDLYPKAGSRKFDALFSLANIYSEEENFEKSLTVYQRIAADSKGLAERMRSARNGLIRKSIAKGTWELRVGEVKLAFKTFRKLIEFSPDTVEAHRGYIQAAAALGKTGGMVNFYKERLKTRQKSAVDHYALGLAHTYLDPPDLAEAEKKIGAALEIDSQQVFFHQTLGWVYEQMESLEKQNGNLERALHEYQMALALNDETLDPENEANLLLNLGNGHYLLKNHFTAFHYYRERERGGIKFVDSNREAIFWQRFGESAFKSGFPSVPAFRKALKLVSEKKDFNRMAELNDRIALAYQDAGNHGKAVEFFTRMLELHRKTGNRVSLTRSLRNIANNLFEMSREKDLQDTEPLNRALAHYFQAIDNLEQYGVADKKKESSALLAIEIEAGLGEDASAAAMGFDREGEEKLIFHYIGKIYGDFGEYGSAIRYFEKKLALIPDNLDLEKNIPVLLEKALLLNQIGNFHSRSGNYDEGLRYFKDSFELSRKLENRHGMAVNAANIGRLVLIQCRSLPLSALREEILKAVAVLESASSGQIRDGKAAEPEYAVILKNYLGIFYHTLAFHLPEGSRATSAGKKKKDLKNLIQVSLGNLERDYGWIQKSIGSFEDGLSLIRENGLSGKGMESALRQNLELIRRLAVKKSGDEKSAPYDPPLFARWQFKYLNAVLEKGEKRLSLLKEAEELLSRLPYGFSRDSSSAVPMMEDLYLALT